MDSNKKSQHVKIYARQRPFNSAETAQKCTSFVNNISHREVVVKTGLSEKRYVFDRVFNEESSQVDVYNTVVGPLIANVIAGYSCTVLAYGQSGTGKTHTIYGEIEEGGEINLTEEHAMGLVPRVANQLFSELSKLNESTEYTVNVSFIEIYNEEVRDLLNNNINLRIYDDPLNKGATIIKDLSKMTAMNTQNVHTFLSSGLSLRQYGSTCANIQRSRSHTLFTFAVDVRESTSSGEIVKSGKIQLVDLAASENRGRFGTIDVRARESGSINRSLTTLIKVIKALAQKIQHVPFRDSKLTRILQESLGNKAKTSMIVTFSPNCHTADESMAGLDLAIAAKAIQSNPQVNINKKHANLMHDLQEEIDKLKSELFAARTEEGLFVSHESYQKCTEEMAKNKEKIASLIAAIKGLEEHYQSLEQEYARKNLSFEQNKTYLENVNLRLQENERKQNTEEVKLNAVVKKCEVVFNKTQVLMDITTKSTNVNDIYYNKYQERDASSSSNAQLAKDMFSLVRSFFENVRNIGADNTILRFQNLIESVKTFERSMAHESEQVTTVLDDFQKRSECYQAKTNALLKNNYNDLRKIYKIVCCILDHQKQSCSELEEANVVFLDKFKTLVETKLLECSIKSEKLRERITLKRAIMKNEYVPLFDRVKSSQEQELHKECLELKEKAAAAEAAIAKSKQQQQIKCEQITTIDDKLKQIEQLMKSTVSEEATTEIQDSGRNYGDSVVATIQTTKSVMNEKVEQMDGNRNDVCNEAASSEQAATDQVNAISSVAKQCLLRRNNALRSELAPLEISLEELQRTTGELNTDILACNRMLNTFAETREKQHNLVKSSAEATFASLSELKAKVSSVGHTGDTPIKATYIYSKIEGKDFSKENEEF